MPKPRFKLKSWLHGHRFESFLWFRLHCIYGFPRSYSIIEENLVAILSLVVTYLPWTSRSKVHYFPIQSVHICYLHFLRALLGSTLNAPKKQLNQQIVASSHLHLTNKNNRTPPTDHSESTFFGSFFTLLPKENMPKFFMTGSPGIGISSTSSESEDGGSGSVNGGGTTLFTPSGKNTCEAMAWVFF